MKKIILKTGEVVPLYQWQRLRRLQPGKMSKNFSVSEFPEAFEISEILIDLLQAYRDERKKPVHLNSTYRTKSKQDELRRKGYRAARYSPHVVGMGADIDTYSERDTREGVRALKKISRRLKIEIRLGYVKYLNDGNTFIHVDVCPEYYGRNKIFHDVPHPLVWETKREW